MGCIKCILKCFNNFSLKIQISLRKYFFQPFLSYGKLKIFIGYCINTTFYDRGHVSDALPSLRGNALPRHVHERGHTMLHLYNNLIIICTHIKLTGIMLMRDRNSLNNIYI